jgi:hypothetical protein
MEPTAAVAGDTDLEIAARHRLGARVVLLVVGARPPVERESSRFRPRRRLRCVAVASMLPDALTTIE